MALIPRTTPETPEVDAENQQKNNRVSSSSSSVRRRKLQQMLTNAQRPRTSSTTNDSGSMHHQHHQGQDFDDDEEDPLEQAAKRNIRSSHMSYSKGGYSIRRRLQHQVDDRLEFDATTFQGLDYEEIKKLREEIHHRCKLSNGAAWKNDLKRAHGESITTNGSGTYKRKNYCEGSQLYLNPKPIDRNISTPRIEIDTSVAKRMGDMTVTPGPTDYFPRPVPSRINNHWIGFIPSSPSKKIDDELKKEAPSPLSYAPHKPLGAERPKYTIQKRPVNCAGGANEDDLNRFSGPTSYPPPISDFDVDRKMPNGATSARFYVGRELRHHSPGPLDTAPSSVTKWVWKDPALKNRRVGSSSSSSSQRRRPAWQTLGNSNYMAELDPLPPSEVAARKRRQEAHEQRVREHQQEEEEEKEGEEENTSTTTTTKQQRKRTVSSHHQQPSSSTATTIPSSHKCVPALLLLHELHKRGYQTLRLVCESGKEANNDPSNGRKLSNGALPAFHFASKFVVENGTVAFKTNKDKTASPAESASLCCRDVHSKYLSHIQLPTRPTTPKPNDDFTITNEDGEVRTVHRHRMYAPRLSKEEVQKYEEECEEYMKGEIATAVEKFVEANKELLQKCKGRDFSYCNWFQKLVRGLKPGDAPLKMDQERLSGRVYCLTVQGNGFDAPPLK